MFRIQHTPLQKKTHYIRSLWFVLKQKHASSRRRKTFHFESSRFAGPVRVYAHTVSGLKLFLILGQAGRKFV